MRICRHEEFEVAHVLPNYSGPCGNLHGHTYKIEVTVEGPQDPNSWGMVVDFNILKKIIKEVVPDHRFIYNNNKNNPLERDILQILNKYNCKTVGYPFDTTAENMSGYFAREIENKLKEVNSDLSVAELKLWETTNSYAH